MEYDRMALCRHGVARARLALRLERDLELNLAGVALALELMEELERLRRELKVRS